MSNRVGQQLGKYRLIQLLGAGAFAEVYLGEHIHLKNQRAIKVLHTVLEEDNAEGFLREAQIIASLDHPHIVRVFDFEVEDHTPFLVMDYFAQGNMRRIFPKGTQIPLPTVVSYIKQIASALQYAHDRKIIHRDIKPENMLIGQQQALAISDFGIALVSQSSRYHTTQEIAGTAAYMAPEQLQGHPQRASDQYALGIVAYEWLTGDIPFHGSFTEIASQHLFMPPPLLSAKVPTIQAEVEQVIVRALAKDPQKRFEDVQAFALAFEQASLAAPSTLAVVQLRQLASTYVSPALSTDAPGRSGSGAQDKVIIAGQFPAPAGNVTTSPVISPDATLPNGTHQPGQHLSRRAVLASIGGVAGLGIGAVAIAWAATTHAGGVSSHTPTLSVRGGTTTTNSSTTVPGSTNTPSTVGNGDTTGDATVPSKGDGVAIVTYPSSKDIWTVAWSPDGKYIASSGDDPTIHVWDVKTGQDVFTYTGHRGKGQYTSVVALAWSPEGDRIVSASTQNDTNGYKPDIQVWNVKSRRLITSYAGHNPAPGHYNTAGSVSWSPDGTRIVTSGIYDGTTQIWNAQTGANIYTYRGQAPHSVWKAAWSPDGKYIASGSVGSIVNGEFSQAGGGTVHVWRTDGMLAYMYNDFPYIGDIAWSPNSKYVASTGSDNQVHIWGATTGIPLSNFTGLYHVGWSPNGRYMAVVELDYTLKATSTVQIFDTAMGTLLKNLVGNTSQVNVVTWSPDGTYLASGSGAGKSVAFIWKVH